MQFSVPEDPEEQEQVSGLNPLITQMPLGRTGLPQYRSPAILTWVGIGHQVRVQVGAMPASNSAAGEIQGDLAETAFFENDFAIADSGLGIRNGQYTQGTVR